MNTTDKGYVRYTQARDVILNEAESIPLSSLLTSEANPSGAMLKNITMTDNGLDPVAVTTPPTVTRGAAVLRPGECADVSGHGTVCNNPASTGLPVSQLIQQYPIRVVLFADIQPFLPFLGTMTARGEAYGQRENVPQGPTAGVVEAAEAGTGSPESPLPPVLPAAGNKEVPVFVNCVPDPAANVIQQSLAYSGGSYGGPIPLAPDDVYSAARDPFCENPQTDPKNSL